MLCLALLHLQGVPSVQWVPEDQDNQEFPCLLEDLVGLHDLVFLVTPEHVNQRVVSIPIPQANTEGTMLTVTTTFTLLLTRSPS